MCGRFTLFTPFDDIIERFSIEAGIFANEFQPSYNIAPSQSVISVINDGTRNRLGHLRWGLIPSWSKDEKSSYKMINARAETIVEKPSFRTSFYRRRCLVIADSFFEWKKVDEKQKVPYRIKLKTSEIFGMAGIWDKWQKPTGETVYSCSILTTTPNHVMSSIHDRMPVIINKSDETFWLDPTNQNIKELTKLLAPYPDELMDTYQVSTLLNTPTNNSPEIIQPFC